MPHRRNDEACREGRRAGPRRHRARQPVLERGVPRRGAKTGDQADPRLRGLRRTRQPSRAERHARGDQQPPRAPRREPHRLSQPHQAGLRRVHGGVLLQAADRQGAAGPARGGARRPERLPEGRGGDGAPHRAVEAGPRGGRDLSGHPGSRQLLPRDAVPGHRGAAGRQQRPPAVGPRPRSAARLHQRRPLPQAGGSPSARRAAVHRHRQERQRRAAPALPRGSVLPEDRGRDARGVRRLSGRALEHRGHRRTLQRRARVRREPPAELRRAGAVHARRLLRARDAGRVPAAPRDVAAAGRRGAAEAPHRRLRGPARLRDRRHRQDALPRLFPHRVGLHPLRPRAGHSRGAGPGIGGGQPRRLVPADHRRRPDAVRPDLRAFPQPGAHLPAGHRHRLLRAPPGRGHRLRHPEVRAGQRRADHHLRHHEGPRRGAGRRPHDGHVVRRRRPGRQADTAHPQHDAREGAGRRARISRASSSGTRR